MVSCSQTRPTLQLAVEAGVIFRRPRVVLRELQVFLRRKELSREDRASSLFVDAMLPDRSRMHMVIPDITQAHWHVNVRKFVVKADHLEYRVRLGTLTRQGAEFLEAAVVAGLNILVAGGTRAGNPTTR